MQEYPVMLNAKEIDEVFDSLQEPWRAKSRERTEFLEVLFAKLWLVKERIQ